MRRLAFLILMLPFAFCCSKQMMAAFGSNSEIVIIAADRCRGTAETLKTILEREILTVQYEKAFYVKITTPGPENPELNHKNIIVLDYLVPKSKLEGKIKSVAGKVFDDLARGEINWTVFHDRWARGQAAIVVTAPTEQELKEVLSHRADQIFAFVDDAVQTRLNKALFYAGEQPEVTMRLKKTYGWGIRIPKGYRVDEKYANERVLKILIDRPARMITVWWEDIGREGMPPDCLGVKKLLAWRYWDGDEVVDESLKLARGQFLGKEATVLTGTWKNEKYTIGGVFVMYCFSCQECRRHYAIDAAVFAPGLEKMPLLRELKAVLATFTCEH